MLKKNRLVLLIVLLLLAVAVGLILTQSRSTFRSSYSDFAVDDTATITKIFMADKNNNSVKLEKTGPGSWTVNGKYPGQKATVEMLLNTMLQLQVKETVPKAAHNTVIRELAAAAVKVEIYQRVNRIEIFGMKLFPHEKLTKVYFVGGATQNNRGTYMLMEHSTEPFVTFMPGLRGFVSPRFSPIEKYWRDYSIFRKGILEIESVKMEFPSNPGYSFEAGFGRERRVSMISLPDRQPVPRFDTLRLMNFLASFRNVSYEALLNDIDPHLKDSILSSPPFTVITLTDTNRVSTTIKTFRKKAAYTEDEFGNPVGPYDLDRLYALVNDGKDFVLIQYFVFDKILRPKPFFLRQDHPLQ